jgi:hypothetical protein
MPGRCDSSRWTPEAARRKRSASGLPRVRGVPLTKDAHAIRMRLCDTRQRARCPLQCTKEPISE